MDANAHTDLTAIEILVVDDVTANLVLLSNILRSGGYSVYSASSGERALQIAKHEKPSIIILDVLMPEMDGFEVCRQLKSNSVTAGIPVIFISALDDVHTKLKGFELGCVDFITKPFMKVEVLARIKTHIRLSLAMIDLERQTKELKLVNKQMKKEIVARQLAEMELRNSKDRYNAFVDANEDMIFLKDDQFRYLVVNDAMARFFGKTKDEMRDKTDSELADEKMIFPCASSDLKAVKSNSAFIIEERLGDRLCETKKFPVKLEGNRIGVGGIIRDVTQQKMIELELIESEEKFRNLADSTPAAIGIYQDDYWVYVNKATENMSGYSLEELHKMKYFEFIAPEFQELVKLNGEKRQAGSKKQISYEFKVICKNGEEKWAYLSGSSITYKGRPAGIISVIDITEKKIAENDILEERKLLRTLIDNLPDPIYVKDKDCRKRLANIADIINIGVDKEEDVIGKTDLELFNEEIGRRGFLDDLKVIQSGISVVNRQEVFYSKAGVKRWLLTSKIPLFDQDGKTSGLVGIGRDITEIKNAEEKIQKLSKGIDQSSSTFVITDVDGNIEYVNPRFAEVTGYTAEEVYGKNPRILKSGEMSDDIYKEMWETITSGEVWRGEFLNRKKNGELFWEGVIITSIKNDDGIITNYIAIKDDISIRKQMEKDLILSKEKAEESDRLKSAFLANMSHEIRTPLNSIIGFSELLSDSHFDIEQKEEFIQHIVDNGNSLLAIISDIMDISKMEAGQITLRKMSIPLKKFLLGINNEYINKYKVKNLGLTIEIQDIDEEIFILSDVDRLRQIFNNLISNALKFTIVGGVSVTYRVDNGCILFHVKDTGIGIPAKYHAQIFERFNQVDTAKTRTYGGNGLGLSITRALVELMGGKIWLDSEPGKGSTFSFTLPYEKQV